jgi:ribosomal protein L3 glutamine methyltransferase
MSIDIDSAAQDLKTIGDLWRYGITLFNDNPLYFGHGTDNSRDEAMWLVYGALKIPSTIEPDFLNARLTLAERRYILGLFERRIKERIPVAYLVHQAMFAGLPFYVDERVLVPRSPLAEIIQSQFEPWLDPEKVTRILDLCTGSACIAIACAYAFPDAVIDAVDISEGALDVAKKNVAMHHVESQVNLIQSDLFTSVAPAQYDIIISNPPYIPEQELADIPPEYRHEPALGLAAGADGLSIVRRIIAEAPAYLKPGGSLIVEVGHVADAVDEAFPDQDLMWIEFANGGEGVFLITTPSD